MVDGSGVLEDQLATLKVLNVVHLLQKLITAAGHKILG